MKAVLLRLVKGLALFAAVVVVIACSPIANPETEQADVRTAPLVIGDPHSGYETDEDGLYMHSEGTDWM